jgi:putative DNA primase/helicase
MGQVALQYARRGWPVFPCRECDGAPYKDRKTGEMKTPRAKAPYTGTGWKDATTDEQRILAWWRSYPNALIGLPTGANGCFVLDFDPRIDEATGEVFTLERLKADLEAQMGCALPRTLTAVTPSDGVHVYFRQPEGDEIRNRGNLPMHVDVRGRGGYVCAPPSRIVEPVEFATPGEYRWIDRGDWRDDAAIIEAPAALIAILRAPKQKAPAERAPSPATGSADRPRPSRVAGEVDDDLRKYAMSAVEGECRAIRQAGSGKRNAQLNESSFKVATLVAAGVIDEAFARGCVESAARDNAGRDDVSQLDATISSGWTAGLSQPRDLEEIAAASKARRERRPSRAASSRPPPPSSDDDGQPSSRTGGERPDDGQKGAGGGSDADMARACAFLPQTDLGNLERFLKRHGRDFLFVEAWGWLAWDGRRWNRDMAMALLGRAVQDTMRAIQAEADLIRDSGVPMPPEGGFTDPDDDDRDEDDDIFTRTKGEQDRRKRKTVLWYQQRALAKRSRNEGERYDAIVQIKSNGDIVLLSDKVASWGRTSESAGHINCIAKMAEPRLARATDAFDADPLIVNVNNGTLAFARPDGERAASMRIRSHRREDLNTKVAPVTYDPAATSPLFDAFLAEVQPDADMRDFLDVWAGYSMTGLADAQKMAIFYGEGSNGKGVWINTVAYILGDYAWSAGIETFIDQGKYRKGSDASPDLAALAGRRMVYANEPEEGSKFSDGLIKSMTSDEPIGGVRELLKPPFELLVTFTNTVSANHKPRIGTDHGIQRRVQVVPWEVIIPDERADLQLKSKLKAEASGILNRMVRGALHYLDKRLPMASAIKEATASYLAENDILGQFVALCIHPLPGEKVGATAMHELFAAWQTWAQQLAASGKPWSAKYLSGQLQRKGFKQIKSSTMQWQDLALQFYPDDFVTSDGKRVDRELPPPRYGAEPRPPIEADEVDFMPP